MNTNTAPAPVDGTDLYVRHSADDDQWQVVSEVTHDVIASFDSIRDAVAFVDITTDREYVGGWWVDTDGWAGYTFRVTWRFAAGAWTATLEAEVGPGEWEPTDIVATPMNGRAFSVFDIAASLDAGADAGIVRGTGDDSFPF